LLSPKGVNDIDCRLFHGFAPYAFPAGGERQRMTVNGLSLSSIMQIP